MLQEITEEAYEASHKQTQQPPTNSDSKNDNSNDSDVVFPISFLISGNGLLINNNFECKHPIIQEILDIDSENFGRDSEKIYWQYVYIFATDPYDCMVLLDDNGIDYEETSSFQLFIFLFTRYMRQITAFVNNCIEDNAPSDFIDYLLSHNIYFDAFRFFLGITSFVITSDENGEPILTDEDGNFLLNEKMFEDIHCYIKAINGIEIPKDRIYPENKAVKQMLIDDMREEQEQKERMRKLGIPVADDEDDGQGVLGKYLSSLTWGGNGGITPFNRNQLHIYDVVDGFKRTNKTIDYKNIMTGIYSGCVNAKSINFKELHWTN